MIVILGAFELLHCRCTDGIIVALLAAARLRFPRCPFNGAIVAS